MPVNPKLPQMINKFLFRLQGAKGLYGRVLQNTSAVHPTLSPSMGRKADRQAGVQIISTTVPIDIEHDWIWFQNLAAISTPEAQEKAQSLVHDWLEKNTIEKNHSLFEEAWKESVLSARICQWIYGWDNLLSNSEDDFKTSVTASFGQQIYHLVTIFEDKPEKFHSLFSLKALILCCLTDCLHERFLPQYETYLENFIKAQQLPDGGIISRNPSNSVQLLEHLSDLRQAYLETDRSVPAFLQHSLDRAASHLKLMSFKDGRLPRFQGGYNLPGFSIKDGIKRSAYQGAAAPSAPHSGYEKMASGKTEIIMDIGAPAKEKLHQKNYHASVGAMEIYVDEKPMIVNCGDVQFTDSAWQLAQRSSSAHSTAILAETNQSELNGLGLGKRRASVRNQRTESAQGSLISITHTGYENQFGYSHNRQIFLYPDGLDFRGLDEFKRVTKTAPPQNFKIRFHLHPTIQVSLLQNQSSALLKMPDGQGWRLRSDGATVSLDESYFGDYGLHRKSKQIILAGLAQGDTTGIKWAFQLEA